MTIYRGPGGAVETTDSATVNTVTTKAAEAATSATNAASSASSAESSASSATNSASTATSQASAASTSATQAASSASAASTSASNASTSETNAATSATTAASSATAATTARTAAEAAQVAAETAETNAAASESTASTAATTATTKASEASTSATTASTAATTASNAATTATTARDQTLAAFDNFDDRYLGEKSSDPSVDNDGDALVGGALYFNSVDGVMKVYTGSQWVAAYADVSGALLAVNNLSDLNNATSARTNLGLGTAATTASTDYATAAQGTLADSAVQPGDLATVATTGAYSDLTGSPTAVSSFTNDSGYITDYTVTQGDVTAHQAALSITESQISDLQSYLTSIPDNYILNTGDAITGDLTFGDNDKAIFGAGSDLQIYHDGSNSWIRDEGTGALYLRASTEMALQSQTGENYLQAIADGTTRLFYDHSTKLETTNVGATVTGNISADGFRGNDNAKIELGNIGDLQIYHDGSSSFIEDVGAGDLFIRGSNDIWLQTASQDKLARFSENGSAQLFYANSSKFTTTSTGIDVTGTAVTDGLEVAGTSKVQQTKEKMTISATAATGTINYDALTQAVLYYTTNASANWTVNVRGDGSNTLNSMMSIGEALTVVFLVTQGSTAYYNSAFQVDGSSVTPKWQGGSAPTEGTASGIDAYTYNIIKTADATFTVLASVADFA